MTFFKSFLMAFVASHVMVGGISFAKEDVPHAPTGASAPQGQDMEAEVIAVVKAVSDQTHDIIKSTEPDKVRLHKLLELFKTYFNVPAIARFVLVKHWAKATDAQKKEYVDLFAKDIAATYFNLLKEHYKSKLKITQAMQRNKTSPDDKGGWDVFSEAEGGNDKVIICWQLMGKKILDVLVDRASMVLAQQKDYSQMVRNHGGLEGFLNWLREKVKKAGFDAGSKSAQSF